MIIDIFMLLLAVVFCVKLLWNVLTPIELAIRSLSTKTKSASTSMVTFVEVGLLLVIIALAAISSGSEWYHRPLKVAMFGSILIVLSYALLIIFGFVLGWIIFIIIKRRETR